MTLLNETDILSQYLEKEVREVLGEEGGGEWVSPQEGRRTVKRCRLRVPGTRWTLALPWALLPCSPPSPLPPAQDCFFYSLVFDPVQKTLLADQGEIRVGCKYQAEIPDRLAEGKRRDGLWLLASLTSESLSRVPCSLHARCCDPDRCGLRGGRDGGRSGKVRLRVEVPDRGAQWNPSAP